MKRYAVLRKNVVMNVILYDGKDEYDINGDQLVDVSATPEVGIGDTKTTKGWKRAAKSEQEQTGLDALETRVEELEKIIEGLGVKL